MTSATIRDRLAKFLATSDGSAALAQAEAAEVARRDRRRAELVADRKRATAELEALVPAERKKIAAAEAALKAHDDARVATVAAVQAAHAALRAIEYPRDRVLSASECELAAIAPPSIAAFVELAEERYREIHGARATETGRMMDGSERCVRHNARAVDAASARVRESIAAARALVFSPMTEAEIASRLAALTAALPTPESVHDAMVNA